MKKILISLLTVMSAFTIVCGAGFEPVPNTDLEPISPIVSTEDEAENKGNQEEPSSPNCEDENELFSDD